MAQTDREEPSTHLLSAAPVTQTPPDQHLSSSTPTPPGCWRPQDRCKQTLVLPSSLLQRFFGFFFGLFFSLKSNLHFPHCNLLLLIQLAAERPQAAPRSAAGLWHLPGSPSLAKRPADSLYYFNLPSHILFSKLLIVCVVNLCPPLYPSWSPVPRSGHTNTPAETLSVPATSKGLIKASYMQQCSHPASHLLATACHCQLVSSLWHLLTFRLQKRHPSGVVPCSGRELVLA